MASWSCQYGPRAPKAVAQSRLQQFVRLDVGQHPGGQDQHERDQQTRKCADQGRQRGHQGEVSETAVAPITCPRYMPRNGGTGDSTRAANANGLTRPSDVIATRLVTPATSSRCQPDPDPAPAKRSRPHEESTAAAAR